MLATALPSSLVAEALTNSAAVSSEIASEFMAGATPSWFAALPSDIQTYLNPVVPTGGPSAGSVAASIQTAHFSSLISNASAIAANATTMTSAAGAGITPVANFSAISHNTTGLAGLQSSFRSMNSSLSSAASSATAGGAAGSSGRAITTSASGSGSAAAAAGSSATASKSSSAGAAVHTAVGLGVAGIAGIVGLLAL